MPWMISGIEGFDVRHGLKQLRQTFEREEFTLQRNKDRVRSRHGVDGEEVERRRAIDQHIAEIADPRSCGPQRLERVSQAKRPVAGLADLQLEAGEIERGWRDGETRHRGREHGILQRLAHQHIVGRMATTSSIDAETG